MKASERLAISRQSCAEQAPEVRVKNFEEVPFGYDEATARIEASRCLRCKKPACVAGCPVGIDIPRFVAEIEEGDVAAAARTLKEANALPAVCGRVCPQESQCEALCIRGKKGEPVAIGRLERFAADWERSHGTAVDPTPATPTGKRVAVVGGGPAGLTVAGELARRGHDVVLFEALHAAGGVLVYGIPEFRLPKDIVAAEVDFVRRLGVEIRCNSVVGKLVSVDELMKEQGFDAVFIGTGAGAPSFMRIPGENLVGVYSANEYLTRSNLMKAYLFPLWDTPVARGRRVAVVGGGNVAMDAARTAIRQGADSVLLLYRRSREEMPARDEEIEHAFDEGVEFHFLTTPIRYVSDRQGRVVSASCLRMELGAADASGRRRPVPIEGSEFDLPVDQVIVAIGNGANPLVPRDTPDMEVNRWGNIVAAEESGKTTKPGVWAGGDIVTGAATVILAMGAGKIAARSMDEWLRGDGTWDVSSSTRP